MKKLSLKNLNDLTVDKKRKETYTDTELRVLLKKPNLKTSVFSEYKVWLFSNYLLGTGNRISTVPNLKIEDIEFGSILKKTELDLNFLGILEMLTDYDVNVLY